MSNNQKKLSNFLKIALDFEDQMSSDIYTQYILRKNWPDSLGNEAFVAIRDSLVKIINDTENHKQIIKGMMQEV